MIKPLLTEHKNLLPIYMILLADVMAFTVLVPLLPFYMERFAATPTVIGLLGTTFGICQFTAGPVLGALSDRYGRKSILLFSQSGTLAGLLLLAFSPSLIWIFIARAVDGATSGNISVAYAYAADISPPKNRARVFGLLGTVFGIGFVVGPSLSSALFRFGFLAPILAAVAFCAISIILTWCLMPGAPGLQREARLTVRDLAAATFRPLTRLNKLFRLKELRWVLAQQAAFAFAFSLYFFGLPLFAERRFAIAGRPFNVQEVGIIFLATGLVNLLLQGFGIGRLVRRFGEEMLVRCGFTLAALGYAVLALATGLPTLIISLFSLSVGNAFLRPSLAAMISRKTPQSEQGLAMGALQSLYSISDIGAPMLAGWLMDHAGSGAFLWHAAWAMSAALLALLGFCLAGALTLPVGNEAIKLAVPAK